MIGLPKSSSPKPTARSMARLGARWTPAVMAALRRGVGMGGMYERGTEGRKDGRTEGRKVADCRDLRSATYRPTVLPSYRSRIVVQEELIRVRPQVDRRDVLGPLHRNPGVQHVGREHVALEQEVVVGLEGGHRLGQRPGHHLDA